MRFSDIAKRITGIGTPIFGVSWTPPVADRDVARRVVTYLGDRRVLYVPPDAEVVHDAVTSVEGIRRFLTEVLSEGGLNEDLAASLRAMRAACRQFMDDVYPRAHADWHFDRFHEYVLSEALGDCEV